MQNFTQNKIEEGLKSSSVCGICLTCCKQVALPKSKLLHHFKETAFVSLRLLAICFEYFLSFLYAIFVILCAVTPRAIGYDRPFRPSNRRSFGEHNSDAAILNSMSGIVDHLEDRQRVEEINHAIGRGEDSNKVKQMRTELFSFRAYDHSRLQNKREKHALIEARKQDLLQLRYEIRRAEYTGRIEEARDLRNYEIDLERDIARIYRDLSLI